MIKSYLTTTLGGKTFQPTDSQHEGISHLCFWVNDIEKQQSLLQKKGIQSFLLHHGQNIYEVNGGKLFKLQAPEGTIIEFRDKRDC
ncbi:VOC family protein [Anaerosporobacter faecicola]|uniref:VOC family protein n=1 Tax=Anaerosporobacter faecicola TaxID=2718714 RepID=UPI001438A231|nr:VOC family protein [Anaerosporobacter faecicola]